VRFAQLAAVWGYAVSQPVFSFLDGNPDFLVLRQPTTFEGFAFAVVVAFGPPLAAVAYAALAGLVSRWVGAAMFLAALAGFLVPLAFQGLKELDPSRALTLVLVVALCALGVAGYVRVRALRLFLTVSVLLPVAAVAWFVHGLPTTVEDAEAAPIVVSSRVPVVLLVLDEFPVTSLEDPSGRIDSTRFPNFGRLARGATWYPNATTVHEFTAHAVPAILTGRMPERGLPTFADHRESLFTLLGGSYAMSVYESMTHLCPNNYCPRAQRSMPGRIADLIGDIRPSYVVKILPESISGVPREADGAPDPLFFRGATASIASYDRFLDDLARDRPERTVHFAHLVLPHKPWRFLPSGRGYGFPDSYAETAGGFWTGSRWAVEQHLQRHLLQAQFVDTLLGRLLRRLDRAGLYDRSLVVVVADHGVSFRPGQSLRAVGPSNFGDIASVPLFVKYPQQAQARIDGRAARTIDVLPTIADVLGARLPWRVDGTSLRGAPVDRKEAVVRGMAGWVRAPMSVVRRQDAAIRLRNARWFGQGSDSLYGIGTHTSLLGTRVGRGVPESATVHVTIEEASELADVRKAGAFVPSHVAGTVDEGRIGAGTELAVAVNGTIRALTRCYVDEGEQHFRALVPEAALVDGFNRVDVYAIAGRGDGVRLLRVGTSDGRG